MRSFGLIVIVGLVIGSCANAWAERERGGKFRENRLEDCRLLAKWEHEQLSAKEAVFATQCRWYIRGYIDGAKNFSEGANKPFSNITPTRELALEAVMEKDRYQDPKMADRNFCFQGFADKQYDEVAKNLLKYIKENPDARKNSFDLLLHKVLITNYPCE